jgi:hypothetical protein
MSYPLNPANKKKRRCCKVSVDDVYNCDAKYARV